MCLIFKVCEVTFFSRNHKFSAWEAREATPESTADGQLRAQHTAPPLLCLKRPTCTQLQPLVAASSTSSRDELEVVAGLFLYWEVEIPVVYVEEECGIQKRKNEDLWASLPKNYKS